MAGRPKQHSRAVDERQLDLAQAWGAPTKVRVLQPADEGNGLDPVPVFASPDVPLPRVINVDYDKWTPALFKELTTPPASNLLEFLKDQCSRRGFLNFHNHKKEIYIAWLKAFDALKVENDGKRIKKATRELQNIALATAKDAINQQELSSGTPAT